MPISCACTGHVAPCLCLQSRSVTGSLDAQLKGFSSISATKWLKRKKQISRYVNPRKMYVFIKCWALLARGDLEAWSLAALWIFQSLVGLTANAQYFYWQKERLEGQITGASMQDLIVAAQHIWSEFCRHPELPAHLSAKIQTLFYHCCFCIPSSADTDYAVVVILKEKAASLSLSINSHSFKKASTSNNSIFLKSTRT